MFICYDNIQNRAKNGELKKNIDQPFEAQSEMIKSVVDDVCVVLVVIFKEEIKNKNKG